MPKVLPSGEPRPRYDADSLLDVAARVFTERGYDGTSMEDLSRASGLSKSSLYHHVASKEQLLRRALERAVDPLFAVIDEPGAVDGRAVDRLEYVIDRAVHVLAERLPYVTLLLHVHGNTETERWALERRRAFDKLLARLVREAVDDGDLRSDMDPSTTARLLLGMVNSLVEWYRPGARANNAADRIAQHITTLAFDGLRERE
ncbi:MAG: TetR/AcrR family transcriptional regulator [Actinomycetia bacterium]|nr:TetR/AcrR family transcriptional regulator [Actinomycetes bacterium]